jgi:molybdate transport system permease protein
MSGKADGVIEPNQADRRRTPLTSIAWSAGGGLLAGALLLLIVLPVAALLFSSSPRDILRGLGDPLVLPAIRLTVLTTCASSLLVVATGTPLAWLLARRNVRASRLAETVIQLPVVLPPAVAGVALLLALGRRGLLGPALGRVGVGLPFTTAAVVLAQAFVAAPFYVQAAIAAFRRLDPDLLLVARTLGASPPRVFVTVAVPLSWSALASGAAMSWARALGEFGATLMFAGNLTGRTQTLPLAVYTALESDLQTAQSLSVVLVTVAVALLVGMRAGLRA